MLILVEKVNHYISIWLYTIMIAEEKSMNVATSFSLAQISKWQIQFNQIIQYLLLNQIYNF